MSALLDKSGAFLGWRAGAWLPTAPDSRPMRRARPRAISISSACRRTSSTIRFPYYRALREHDPVHRMPDGAYFITRWRDCDTVYRDARVFSSDKKIEFGPKYGDAPLYRASHHQPRVQRPAAAHPCAPRDPDGAVEPRHRRDGGGAGRAGRPPARRDGAKGPRRPDRGFRRRHSGRDHRQSARRAACGSRAAARLVACDPRRARAGADATSRWRSATTAVRDSSTI